MLIWLAFLIGGPFFFAAVALLVARWGGQWSGRVALLAPALVTGLGLWLWAEVSEGARVLVPLPWFPTLGLSASLRVDRWGVFFVLLVGLIGLGVVQYARHYFGLSCRGSFFALLLSFMGSMLGIVLADSLLLLFVFWELTTVTSALLIGFEFQEKDARKGAVLAFLVTSGGGLCLLAGLVLLALLAGSADLSTLEARSSALLAVPAHTAALVLLLLGAFTKSAQFPFTEWLPGAMTAATPVSAYLHSATMVKAGVFLVGRLFPIFSQSPLWEPLLISVGMATFLIAGSRAVRSFDLKQILAYSTAAYLGLIFAFYGYAARAGAQGEILLVANHALYKSALFLLVGWLEKATGTRDLRILLEERWLKKEPWGALLFAIGAAALAGAPLLLSFFAKEKFFQSLLTENLFPYATLLSGTLAVIASALAVTAALKLVVGTFFGPKEPSEKREFIKGHIPRWLLIVPALLLLPQLVGGIAPGWLLSTFLAPGTQWSRGPAFWHEVNIDLLMGLSSYTLGLVLYAVWRRLAYRTGAGSPYQTPEKIANLALGFSSWLGQKVQAGGHPRFLSVLFLSALAALLLGAFLTRSPIPLLLSTGPDLYLAWFPALAIAAAALSILFVPGRIPRLIMLSLSGYGLVVFYSLFRAPDLALTQILVETVSLVLFLLIFRHMPPIGKDARSRPKKVLHGVIALVVGVVMAFLAWQSGIITAPQPDGAEHLARASSEARGQNVVNVLLVDFRAADTLGEITVLVIAALGVTALFRAGRLFFGKKGAPK